MVANASTDTLACGITFSPTSTPTAEPIHLPAGGTHGPTLVPCEAPSSVPTIVSTDLPTSLPAGARFNPTTTPSVAPRRSPTQVADTLACGSNVQSDIDADGGANMLTSWRYAQSDVDTERGLIYSSYGGPDASSGVATRRGNTQADFDVLPDIDTIGGADMVANAGTDTLARWSNVQSNLNTHGGTDTLASWRDAQSSVGTELGLIFIFYGGSDASSDVASRGSNTQ